jgi:23S rRNA (cytosine1962-C5)-methyltransferase
MQLGDVIARTDRALFHALLDSGAGYRLERFGGRVLARPDPNALWEPRLPKAEWQRLADAWFHREQRFGTSHWERRRAASDPWMVEHGSLRFALRLTAFKHTGIFPEQAANWAWIAGLVRRRLAAGGDPPRLLNLFAYTGAASLVAAAAGAEVCHLDASKDSVAWARENQRLSGLESAPLRWIVDDAGKFLARERRRGRRYDGIILDPPAYGRDPSGGVFRFETHLPPLLAEAAELLSERPLGWLLNAYSLGYSATVAGALLAGHAPPGPIELGELRLLEEALPGKPRRPLPCSVYARWTPAGDADS